MTDRVTRIVFVTLASALVLTEAACSGPGGNRRTAANAQTGLPGPADSEIPGGPLGAAIVRGRALLLATGDSLPGHVGNALRCASCHLDGGRRPNGSWVGVFARYPQYRSRSNTVETIEYRINDCLQRSLNGKAVPVDGPDMRDMVTFMAFLSRGVPVAPPQAVGARLQRFAGLTPDTTAGAAIYASACGKCHGADGHGTPVGPPVWGPRSYNIGAGMARIRTAASFIRDNMPFDTPGSLTDQQALNVAAFMNSRPRPDYPNKEYDWPLGDPPPDVAYPTLAAQRQSGAVARSSLPDTENLYAAAGVNMLNPATARALPRAYVPNDKDGTVSVIDLRAYRVIETIRTGARPEHVVPSYDLKTLWVANNSGNSLTPIDPITEKAGSNVAVEDPYNLYFTPDGRHAIVVAEAHRRLDFRNPHTMELETSVPVDCKGVDHMEFTRDGRYAIATCEFSGQVLKLDVASQKVIGYLLLDPDGLGLRAMPQDIRSSPDGRVFYVADMMADGVFLIDPDRFERTGFIATGKGTHGIYPSRNGRLLYVSNRGWNTVTGGPHGPGSVTVIDPTTRHILTTWQIPGGGSPDMGNLTADGKELWLTGRYDAEVYVFETASGRLTHRIKVGNGPHGMTVWPQPGRYSLGHTGNMR
jgi:YVTN family beta-propeller protein